MNDIKKKVVLEANAVVNNTTEYRFSLELLIFKDENGFVAYCPALDLSAYADSYNEAIANFYEVFQLHIECCVESGTLQDDLLAHGWKLRKKSLMPPALASMMKKPELKRLFASNTNFERVVTPARIAMLS